MTSISHKFNGLILSLTVTWLVSGCEVYGDNFKEVIDNINPFVKTTQLKRAPLVDFPAEVELNEIWDTDIGKGLGSEFIRIKPSIADDKMFAADRKGLVIALDRASGDELWETELGVELSGGIGVGADIIAVGSEDGEVLAIAQATGQLLWRAPVSSEILSVPAINQNIAVIQTLDGKLFGLATESGARRWVYETTVPSLSLRGTSSPIIADDLAYAGFANGKLVAVNIRNGDVVWENQVALAQGRSDIERIVDVDGTPILVGSILYVTSYQGRIVALNARTGRLLWQQENSSYQGIGEGFGNIYLADDESRIVAIDQESNQVLWDQPAFERREVTSPVVFKDYIALGDYEGYLHLISQVDGHLVGRIQVGRGGIRTTPLVTEDTLYVLTNRGKLSALTLELLNQNTSQEQLEEPEKPDADFSN